MAAAVYGGSPRHHNRIINSNTINPVHLSSHPTSLQQSTPFISGSQPAGNIIVPPASYISSSTPTVSSTHYHHPSMLQLQRHSKRKSAVEMLAESKPFYVKSETVLDRQQQLNIRGNAPSCVISPSRTLPHNRAASRRCASTSSDLLQTKLRKLLNAGELKDISGLPPPPDIGVVKYKSDSPNSKYDQFAKYHSTKITQELTVHPDQGDVSVFFPSAFLSPQSLPPHPVTDEDIYSYGIDDSLVLTDDYRAISPPAEYAADNSVDPSRNASRYGYQRSYSHSQAVVTEEPDYSPSYNINSHKSLPDLHSQICRHSPHSEAQSCCSRGNRSNKSGSSFNRDSGGSSGHYTHHSEPCCKQKDNLVVTNCEFRRDSGSSTQHSGNSYYAYGIPPVRYDCLECRAKIQKDADCLLNFTTPEVPEAFQDDFNEKSKRYYEEAMARGYYKSSPKNQSPTAKVPHLQSEHTQVLPHENELSPPLGTFKRQKCLRFKHRARYPSPNDRNVRSDEDRRPILRSKSDISDRYWNRNTPMIDTKQATIDRRGKSESLSQLERFFDRLGLNDEKYEEIMTPKTGYSSDNDSDSSAVFFSDVSTVDSNRLPDSTDNSSQTPQPYRNSEPPSIVERNARIIKWLCNCRKLQLT